MLSRLFREEQPFCVMYSTIDPIDIDIYVRNNYNKYMMK